MNDTGYNFPRTLDWVLVSSNRLSMTNSNVSVVYHFLRASLIMI